MKYQRLPVYDTAANSTAVYPATTYSWTHNLASEPNKLIIVCAGGNRNASSVTLNTFTNFTKLTEVTGNGVISIWYLVYVGTDLSPTITANFDGGAGLTSGSSYSFYDVPGTNIFGDIQSTTTGGLYPSLTLDSGADVLMFDLVQTVTTGGLSFSQESYNRSCEVALA